MTHTVVSSDKKEVVIGFDRPFFKATNAASFLYQLIEHDAIPLH